MRKSNEGRAKRDEKGKQESNSNRPIPAQTDSGAPDWSIRGRGTYNPELGHRGGWEQYPGLENSGRPKTKDDGPLDGTIRRAAEPRRATNPDWIIRGGPRRPEGPLDWSIWGAADRSPQLEHRGKSVCSPRLHHLGLNKKEEVNRSNTKQQRKQERDPRELRINAGESRRRSQRT